jgi:hypothetical protein
MSDESTAYHEAGHAVIGHMLGFEFVSVMIEGADGGGVTTWAEPLTPTDFTVGD